MKVVTAREMKDIDMKAIQEFGIPGLVLMERAGLAVTKRIREIFGRKKIIVIAGSGNNGGDGLVIGRELYHDGWDVSVFLTTDPEKLSGDALAQYRIAERFGVPLYPVSDLFSRRESLLSRHSLIIDAIFGTGLSKPVSGAIANVIAVMNDTGLPILSVDIPSGISSDDGQVLGVGIKASCTVTFGLPKRGHLLHPGAAYAGELFIEDIGFPRSLLTAEEIPVEYLERNRVSEVIPARKRYSHKGDYGHVLIVAGSRGKTGAALMAARACLRSGAGLVTVGVPQTLGEIFQSRFTEEMTLMLPDRGDGSLSSDASRVILEFTQRNADVLAIGPGLGVTEDTTEMLSRIVSESACPMVVDADGLNSIRGAKQIFAQAKAPVILTPHPGEMRRLLQEAVIETADIEGDRIEIARSFAKETGTYLVLKGVPTIVAAPNGKAYVNSTGNPGMATAGTGDVLTGMISGFLAQLRNPLTASIISVYLHGLAGDSSASKKGEYSLLATDIIEAIPVAFDALRSEG